MAGTMDSALYSVGTWDTEQQTYTPQVGLLVPSLNITLAQLRQAVRELKKMGHEAHRLKHFYGHNDHNVLIERTDDKPENEIMESWRR